MIQLHFGSSRRLLYGLYHPASPGRLRRSVLILNPYGWEALRAHRTLATLAGRLETQGFDVLRFDYSCTGDSLGETEDASYREWLDDAEFALDELLAMSGVGRANLVGIRMGALIAEELAARRGSEVDRRVLWAPPAEGSQVVEWARTAPGSEAQAFPVGRRLEEELRAARPVAHRDPGKVLVVTDGTGGLPVADPGGVEMVRLPADQPRCWVEDRDHGAGAVPVAVLERITEWLR